MGLETGIQQQIQKALNADGRVRVRRNLVGTGTTPYGNYVTYGLGDGSPDLVGYIKGSGRVFCVECKTPKKGSKLEADQVAWARTARKHGCFVCVARSVPDALAAVDRAVNGGSE